MDDPFSGQHGSETDMPPMFEPVPDSGLDLFSSDILGSDNSMAVDPIMQTEDKGVPVFHVVQELGAEPREYEIVRSNTQKCNYVIQGPISEKPSSFRVVNWDGTIVFGDVTFRGTETEGGDMRVTLEVIYRRTTPDHQPLRFKLHAVGHGGNDIWVAYTTQTVVISHPKQTPKAGKNILSKLYVRDGRIDYAVVQKMVSELLPPVEKMDHASFWANIQRKALGPQHVSPLMEREDFMEFFEWFTPLFELLHNQYVKPIWTACLFVSTFMNKAEVEEMLRGRPGTFLLRLSATSGDRISISFCVDDEGASPIQHFPVELQEIKKWRGLGNIIREYPYFHYLLTDSGVSAKADVSALRPGNNALSDEDFMTKVNQQLELVKLTDTQGLDYIANFKRFVNDKRNQQDGGGGKRQRGEARVEGTPLYPPIEIVETQDTVVISLVLAGTKAEASVARSIDAVSKVMRVRGERRVQPGTVYSDLPTHYQRDILLPPTIDLEGPSRVLPRENGVIRMIFTKYPSNTPIIQMINDPGPMADASSGQSPTTDPAPVELPLDFLQTDDNVPQLFDDFFPS